MRGATGIPRPNWGRIAGQWALAPACAGTAIVASTTGEIASTVSREGRAESAEVCPSTSGPSARSLITTLSRTSGRTSLGFLVVGQEPQHRRRGPVPEEGPDRIDDRHLVKLPTERWRGGAGAGTAGGTSFDVPSTPFFSHPQGEAPAGVAARRIDPIAGVQGDQASDGNGGPSPSPLLFLSTRSRRAAPADRRGHGGRARGPASRRRVSRWIRRHPPHWPHRQTPCPSIRGPRPGVRTRPPRDRIDDQPTPVVERQRPTDARHRFVRANDLRGGGAAPAPRTTMAQGTGKIVGRPIPA